MKRIGFISDDLDAKEPISRALSEFSDPSSFKVESLDRLNPSLPLTIKIHSLLEMCDVIVFYISRGSTNIFYEIGLAHGSRKNVVILTKSPTLIPFDLSHQKCIIVNDNNFDIIKYEIHESIFGKNSSFYYEHNRHHTNEHFYDAYFRNVSSELDFRDLYALTGNARAEAFERWFSLLARNVIQWDVIEANTESQSGAFDFLLWNKADDPEFHSLGNPIPVELKALNSMNNAQIKALSERLRKHSLKSLLLLTTAKNRRNSVKIFHTLKKENNSVIVALDRDDLIDVRTPRDLYFAIKKQLLEVVYRGN